jgi:hypothetical protein
MEQAKLNPMTYGMPVSNRAGMERCVHSLSILTRQLETGIRIGRSSVVSPLLRWTVIEIARYREVHVVDKAVDARLAVPCKLLSSGNISISEVMWHNE